MICAVGYYLSRHQKTTLRPNRLRTRALRTIALATLALAPALFAQQPRASRPATLPAVTANALDKAKVTLPADFSSPLNLLILSFTRDQQDAVETWHPVAVQLADESPKVQAWLLPVSIWEDSLYKWWLNSSMRSSLPEGESPHYTVPLYVNMSPFLKSLDISSQKQIVVLLTNKQGVVLWRGQGAATEESKAALADFVKKLPASF